MNTTDTDKIVDNQIDAPTRKTAQSARNLAIALLLIFFIIAVYFVTIFKMGARLFV